MTDRRLDIDEVTARLGVKRETVYAYVSRGQLHSEPASDHRGSTFDQAEVEELAARGRPRRRPRPGEGIAVALDSAVTELADGSVRYRGHRLEGLVDPAHPVSFEAVAELLWTGRPPDAEAPPPWVATEALRLAARRAVAALGEGADEGDRLRMAVVAASAADPMRHDLRPEAVCGTARSLIAAVLDALADPTTPATPTGAPEAAVAPGPAVPPIAQRVATALDRRVSRRWWRPIEVALIVLADHELATSTLAARVAASTRADPAMVVLAGLAAVSGPLHGTASVQTHRFLLDAATDPAGALAEQLRRGGPLASFGHPVHRRGDPRTALVLDAVRRAANPRRAARLAVVDDIVQLAAQRAPLAPNVDFALAALAFVAGLPVGSSEVVFSVARMVGWIAHALEEYDEEPLRYRARARTRMDLR